MSHKVIALPHIIKFLPLEPIKLDGVPNVYSFDLDHTLIKPKTPNTIFGKTAQDWKFMCFVEGKLTVDKLLQIVRDDPMAYFAIFTNQGGVLTVPTNSKSFYKFKLKIQLILEDIAKLPDGRQLVNRLWIYASTKRPSSKTKKNNDTKGVRKLTGFKNVQGTLPVPPEDNFALMRKPEIGLFTECNKDFKRLYPESETVCRWVFYCGDAAGRSSDFSDSDRIFAEKANIPFKIPEEVFK